MLRDSEVILHSDLFEYGYIECRVKFENSSSIGVILEQDVEVFPNGTEYSGGDLLVLPWHSVKYISILSYDL
jgi:hypothetical protein